jgi:hypothetical protein
MKADSRAKNDGCKPERLHAKIFKSHSGLVPLLCAAPPAATPLIDTTGPSPASRAPVLLG